MSKFKITPEQVSNFLVKIWAKDPKDEKLRLLHPVSMLIFIISFVLILYNILKSTYRYFKAECEELKYMKEVFKLL